MKATDLTHRAPWPRIAVFTLLAACIAYPFRHGSFNLQAPLFLGVPFLQAILEGMGVFIAALIATSCFTKYWSPANYFGDSPLHSSAVLLTPIAVFTIFGVDNTMGVNSHLFGLVLATSIAIYCILEETGWRGFLQNATTSIPRAIRYLIVGLIWYVWHLSFINHGASLIGQLQFLVILIIGSYLLGSLVEKTNSVLLAASFHFCINFLAFSYVGGINETQSAKLLLVGIIVLAWIPVLFHWNKNKNHVAQRGL
ncbi:type II CAAX prenyl endopeptidase Rce1 family protein [Luteimonas soli]|uniref:Type II CAAX prenyl endopeptidase Rce1 family protein n=1 Tax=Luteimonas soli TaxID=1648966 RepID=A0ABV7XKU6_9GAMM